MNPSNQSAPPRKSRGRQKVNMVKMEKQSNLQVTFSKRRAGLFKKASELCTLCGAEAAIAVFSPAQKLYCFGHPNVQTLLHRFSAGAAPVPANPRSQFIIDAHRSSTIRELNLEVTQVESLLRAEKRRTEEIEMVRKTGRMQQWLPASLDELNYAQLCVLEESIMGFKKNLDGKVQGEMLRVANEPLPFHHQPAAEKTENPNGLAFIPTFNNAQQLSLGMSDFGSYDCNGAIGLGNVGLFAPNNGAGEGISNNIAMSNAMFFGINDGSDGSSSSKLPTESSMEIGRGGFGVNLGHDPRLF